MKTDNNELYILECFACHMMFKAETPNDIFCPDCARISRRRKKKNAKKVLTITEILRIGDAYYKINHKYLHYGDIVTLVDNNVDRCVCCGEIVPEGRHVCPRCEKAVK